MARFRETNVPDARCPHCNEAVNVATSLGAAARPADGNSSMCFYCGGLVIFTDGATKVRAPSPLESMALEMNPQIAHYRLLLAEVKRRNRK